MHCATWCPCIVQLYVITHGHQVAQYMDGSYHLWRPKHPKIPPPEKNLFACVSEPQEHFWKKKFSSSFFFLRFKTPLRPQEHFLAKFCFQLKIPPALPPTCTPPPTHPNPRAIINNPNNCSIMVWHIDYNITTNTSNKYTMSVMYTSYSLPINVHTILVSNPLTQCLYAADIIYKMSNRLVY